jgi:hypothetical protein
MLACFYREARRRKSLLTFICQTGRPCPVKFNMRPAVIYTRISAEQLNQIRRIETVFQLYLCISVYLTSEGVRE